VDRSQILKTKEYQNKTDYPRSRKALGNESFWRETSDSGFQTVGPTQMGQRKNYENQLTINQKEKLGWRLGKGRDPQGSKKKAQISSAKENLKG